MLFKHELDRFKVLVLSMFLCLVPGILSEVPGKPDVKLGQRIYPIVEVNSSATAYEYLVKRKEAVDVFVTWDIFSGGTPDRAVVLLNGKECWSGSIGSRGSATVQVSQGGKYEMIVKVCNPEGCSVSSPTEVVVADTDGSHLSPLKYSITDNNKEFKQTSRKVVASYFFEWGVYVKKYFVNNIPVPNLTHILYGFIGICGGNGINEAASEVFDQLQRSCTNRDDFKVTIRDQWAALQQPQGDLSAWDEPYKGNLGQLMALKQSNKQIKILASIGGWSLSGPFFLMGNKEKRDIFVESVKEFLLTWKFFDGVDIHWQFPGINVHNPDQVSSQDGDTYFLLMKELREMLTQLSKDTGKYYQLASTINVSWDKPKIVNYTATQRLINNFFLMNYEYKGPWTNDVLGHHTALFAPEWKRDERLTIDENVKYLLSQGVEAKRIVVGVAMYGRGWTGVHGYTGNNPFTGRATGPLQSPGVNGIVDYKDIAKEFSNPEWQFSYDETAQGAYMFKSSTGDLITYDSEKSVLKKADYVKKNKLGGLVGRDISGDNGDILNAMNIGLGNSVV